MGGSIPYQEKTKVNRLVDKYEHLFNGQDICVEKLFMATWNYKWSSEKINYLDKHHIFVYKTDKTQWIVYSVLVVTCSGLRISFGTIHLQEAVELIWSTVRFDIKDNDTIMTKHFLTKS